MDESVDGTPRQRTWDDAVDGFRHVAKVRVASSNLVIRSVGKARSRCPQGFLAGPFASTARQKPGCRQPDMKPTWSTERVRAVAVGLRLGVCVCGTGVDEQPEVELGPDAIAVAANDACPTWWFVVVADENPIAGLRVEAGILGARPVADPGLHHQIGTDAVGVVPEVVGGGVHEQNCIRQRRRAKAGLWNGPRK